MEIITPEQLKSRLDAGETPVLLDVREDWEYKICSIPGSINISMSNVNRMLDELSPTDITVIICHHGMRSYQVGCFLENNGFGKIMNLEGGVDVWAKTIDLDMAQY